MHYATQPFTISTPLSRPCVSIAVSDGKWGRVIVRWYSEWEGRRNTHHMSVLTRTRIPSLEMSHCQVSRVKFWIIDELWRKTAVHLLGDACSRNLLTRKESFEQRCILLPNSQSVTNYSHQWKTKQNKTHNWQSISSSSEQRIRHEGQWKRITKICVCVCVCQDITRIKI